MKKPVVGVYVCTVLLLILCSLLTLIQGATPLNVVWEGVLMRLQGLSNEWNPLLDERLPRLIVILCTGASLAVSGAVMQSLFHNPLASPSVLGISAGGSLFVILVFIVGGHLTHPYAIPVAAFGGCLLTLCVVYLLSRRAGQVQLHTLILTGIAIATLLMAVQEAMMYALRDQWQLIQTLTEWRAGSTLDRNWRHVHMQLPLTLVGLFGCWYYSREIDLLSLGEEDATMLGVEVAKVRWRLFLCVSLLTGGSIATVGIVPFFALVLPHIIRKLFGPNNRRLTLLCILLGSSTLILMDQLIRIFAIHSFSIGNISAIVGGAFFLLLLLGSRTGSSLQRFSG